MAQAHKTQTKAWKDYMIWVMIPTQQFYNKF